MGSFNHNCLWHELRQPWLVGLLLVAPWPAEQKYAFDWRNMCAHSRTCFGELRGLLGKSIAHCVRCAFLNCGYLGGRPLAQHYIDAHAVVGAGVGSGAGSSVGFWVGSAVGFSVGSSVGSAVGSRVGSVVGFSVGTWIYVFRDDPRTRLKFARTLSGTTRQHATFGLYWIIHVCMEAPK